MMIQLQLLKIIAIICFVLLFVGGPGSYAERSLSSAWNLGHIFFFANVTYLALYYMQKKTAWPYIRQCLIIILAGIFFGITIEILQKFSGRFPSIVDVGNDLGGILLACAFFGPARKTLPINRLRAFQLISVLAVLSGIYPLARALTDEQIAAKQFPVLADLETPFELKRWEGKSRHSIDHAIFRHGNASMKVELNTSKYSGISLTYFPHDWSGYRLLRFSIYNPSGEPLTIHCRAHDKQHDLGNKHYYDRFNATFNVLPGWNDFEVPLEEIMNGPKDRKMALNDIRGLGFFVVQLPEPQVIFVDHVRLIR